MDSKDCLKKLTCSLKILDFKAYSAFLYFVSMRVYIPKTFNMLLNIKNVLENNWIIRKVPWNILDPLEKQLKICDTQSYILVMTTNVHYFIILVMTMNIHYFIKNISVYFFALSQQWCIYQAHSFSGVSKQKIFIHRT